MFDKLLTISVLRRSCDRRDDRGPRDVDQPRAGGAEKEAADPAWREPTHLTENDEIQSSGQHTNT